LSVGLEGPGWFCSSLDLGYPDVRDVVSNRPDQDGIDDRTRFFGGRTVTAEITALAGAGAVIDAVAASFAPFMAPSARPTLHYVLDRPGAAERTMTLRAAGYSWPVAGPYQRDIQLQWVAADPAAVDPVQKTATAWAGSSTTAGRNYPWTPNRIYPVGGSSPTSAIVSSAGDLPFRPLLRIYGPVTAPAVWLNVTGDPTTGPTNSGTIQFVASYTIPAGQWVDVDLAAKTVRAQSDPNQSVLNQIDWVVTSPTWPAIPPLPGYARMQMGGSSRSGVTQVQASWYDRYLT
jgi:hypothetical protein